MQSNFSFLKENFNFLSNDIARVEKFAHDDPRTSAFYARRTLELALNWLFDNDTALKRPYDKKLAALLYEPTFKNNIKSGLFEDLRYIHKLGNLAAHDNQVISNQDGIKICRAVYRFTGWLARVYTRGSFVPTNFQLKFIPKSDSDVDTATTAQLELVRNELVAKDKAAREAQDKQKQTEQELEALKQQLASLQVVKQENLETIPSSEYSESETRKELIDVMLREVGWDLSDKRVIEYPVTGMPNKEGELVGDGFVDYVLWGNDGLPLAVVEAKRTSIDPEQGKQQAKLYADCLEKEFKRRPFVFYTNGIISYFWDDFEYPPREVSGFYARDELQTLINRRNNKENLELIQPKPEIAGRSYQFEAAARVMQAYQNEKKRKALIVMATGSGKTRLSISIVDMLMRAGWVKRVLFLADRIALVNQAKKNYTALLPHVTTKNLLDRDADDDARIVFSTYPTMMNVIDGGIKDGNQKYSVGYFDLIIIDEAHRSIYQRYGAIFDYFDAMLLGLTATPRGDVDRNTYKLFQLEKNQPTFAYELEQAVQDKWLVPPKAMSVPLKFQREGIKYNELSPEEQEDYELNESFHDEDGNLIEEIGSAALNRWLFNEDTVKKVLQHLMEDGIKIEGGDRLGKTIIFAKNKDHAKFIVKVFDENYPEMAGQFCRRIDYSIKYAQSLIDDFELKDNPGIVSSVDMLDTGIDVPPIVNLVFFKLVRSKVKFWQMVGRGTRLCEDLFGPGKDKKEFVIFDYCQNLEYFNANPEGYESKQQEPIKQKIFKRRLALAMSLQSGQASDESIQTYTESIFKGLQEHVAGLNVDNFIIRKARAEIEHYSKPENWKNLTEKQAIKINTQLSGLPHHDNDDEKARRFDLLIVNLQLALLKGTGQSENYIKKIQQIANDLEDKNTIPKVNAQMELILELQTDLWWVEVTIPLLENVRKRLRDLIVFIDRKTGVTTVYTDFEDEIDTFAITEHEIISADELLLNYRERIRAFINKNRDHITIRRLQNNEPVSKKDIEALEDILFTNHVLPKNEYKKVFSEQPLGYLVRSVVGLDRRAAKEAFASFLEKAPLHPDQISFLNEVIEYLVKNGTLQPKDLFENPFTNYHSLGVKGVMGEDAEKIVNIVDRINKNSVVA